MVSVKLPNQAFSACVKNIAQASWFCTCTSPVILIAFAAPEFQLTLQLQQNSERFCWLKEMTESVDVHQRQSDRKRGDKVADELGESENKGKGVRV